MKTWIFALCLLLLPVVSFAQGGSPPGAYGPATSINSTSSAPYNEINAAAAPYNVTGGGAYSTAATMTNGSSTVTCPSTDCGFTSADVGKACTGFTANSFGTQVLPNGCTIQTVTDSTHVVVSVTANASASGTNNGTFYYGTDQTTGVTAAFTAEHALSRCGTIRFPSGYITIKGTGSASPYGTQPATCHPNGSNIDNTGEDIGGQGKDTTYLVFLPDYGASNSFIFNNNSGPVHLHDMHILCNGWSAYLPTTPVTSMIDLISDSTVANLKISGCGQSQSATSLKMGGSSGFCSWINVYQEYSAPFEIDSRCSIYNTFFMTQLFIGGSATVNDYGGLPGQGQTGYNGLVDNSHGGTYNCYGCIVFGGSSDVALRMGGGSVAHLNAATIGNTTGGQYGIFWDTGGGTVWSSQNTSILGGTNGALNNVSNNIPAVFNDDGTTVFTGSITNFTGQSNSKYLFKPQTVGSDVQTAKAAAQTAKTLFTVGGTTTLFRVHLSVECTTTSASATVTPAVLYTDTSGTVQTVTGTAATCTALGAASNTSQDVTFRAKNATNIQYQTTIVNTPTYDISVAVEQLAIN